MWSLTLLTSRSSSKVVKCCAPSEIFLSASSTCVEVTDKANMSCYMINYQYDEVSSSRQTSLHNILSDHSLRE